jgi:hypothetical protein
MAKAMATYCQYMFPTHPLLIIEKTPDSVSNETRLMRSNMITMIAEMSSMYSQDKMDNLIFIDIEDRHIIGFDISRLIGADRTSVSSGWCVGNNKHKLKLKDMTAKMWTHMMV